MIAVLQHPSRYMLGASSDSSSRNYYYSTALQCRDFSATFFSAVVVAIALAGFESCCCCCCCFKGRWRLFLYYHCCIVLDLICLLVCRPKGEAWFWTLTSLPRIAASSYSKKDQNIIFPAVAAAAANLRMRIRQRGSRHERARGSNVLI